jgi:hypothetical protein
MRQEEQGVRFALRISIGPRGSQRRLVRFRPVRNALWGLVLGVAAPLAAPAHARAQEPVAPLPDPNVYAATVQPHHWWSFLCPNDGIPRTYSYYYTPWLNQPRHFPVVGPNGKTHWMVTVRGLPMGSQWMAP